jgi:hypothetical protein
MSADTEQESIPFAVSTSTLRVRRHRERRRKGYYLLTLEMPERITEAAITRGLLKPEDRALGWVVLQAAFASMLSDKALSWLVRNGVIRSDQRADAVGILRRISKWLEEAGA